MRNHKTSFSHSLFRLLYSSPRLSPSAIGKGSVLAGSGEHQRKIYDLPFMNIQELQQWVRADWEQHSNNKPDPHLQLLYLFEELGEMAEAIRKNGGYKDRKDEVMDLEGEMGDVLIALATVANNYGIDLEAAVVKSKAKIEERHKGGF